MQHTRQVPTHATESSHNESDALIPHTNRVGEIHVRNGDNFVRVPVLPGPEKVPTRAPEKKPDDEQDKSADEQLDATEKLIKSVLEDTYAKESMAILVDLAEQQAAVASKEHE